jgi:hypothetical protein
MKSIRGKIERLEKRLRKIGRVNSLEEQWRVFENGGYNYCLLDAVVQWMAGDGPNKIRRVLPQPLADCLIKLMEDSRVPQGVKPGYGDLRPEFRKHFKFKRGKDIAN